MFSVIFTFDKNGQINHVEEYNHTAIPVKSSERHVVWMLGIILHKCGNIPHSLNEIK